MAWLIGVHSVFEAPLSNLFLQREQQQQKTAPPPQPNPLALLNAYRVVKLWFVAALSAVVFCYSPGCRMFVYLY
jgi:hypothetical protein